MHTTASTKARFWRSIYDFFFDTRYNTSYISVLVPVRVVGALLSQFGAPLCATAPYHPGGVCALNQVLCFAHTASRWSSRSSSPTTSAACAWPGESPTPPTLCKHSIGDWFFEVVCCAVAGLRADHFACLGALECEAHNVLAAITVCGVEHMWDTRH
jgi:hypothetical protein